MQPHQDILATPDAPGRDITRARELLGDRFALGRPLSCLEMADALELTGANARRREYVEQLEHETRDTSGPVRVAIRAMLAGFTPQGLAPVIAVHLAKSERFLVEWLAREDASALGECHGPDLNRLVALGLARVAGQRVTLTESGQAVAVCVAFAA